VGKFVGFLFGGKVGGLVGVTGMLMVYEDVALHTPTGGEEVGGVV
jgi:hypothetical protein